MSDQIQIDPRGVWQIELVREWREANDIGSGCYPTRDDLIEIVNEYDAQLEAKIGEGSHAEGRAFLRLLIKAGNAMLGRASKAARKLEAQKLKV